MDSNFRAKKWPWWLFFIKPHDGASNRKLMRCSCGRAMWSDAPQTIRRFHAGHKMTMCQEGSVWEFFKMKVGLLNVRTVGEWIASKVEESK